MTEEKKIKAVVFDLDGVIFKHRNFWARMHEAYGTIIEGEELTKKYLKTNFEKLIEGIIGRLWKGKDSKKYYELISSSVYNNGVKQVFQELKKRGMITAIISSAAYDLAFRAKEELGIDFIYANKLGVNDGKITGEFFPVHDFYGKNDTFSRFCEEAKVNSSEVVVVGDGENDIPMLKVAGKGIGFNLLEKDKEKIEKFCDCVVEGDNLSKILDKI